MLHEFHGLQKREYRVDPRRAGRLVTASAASAGDYYSLKETGYGWVSQRMPIVHYLSASFGPFSFVKTGGFAGSGGDAVARASLVEESVELPIEFPAALSHSADFVPFTFWYALADGLAWGSTLLVAASFRDSLLGRTPSMRGKRLTFFATQLFLWLVVVRLRALVFPRVAAVGGLTGPQLSCVANGAVFDARLKLFLVLAEVLGALGCLALLLGSLHPLVLYLVMPCFVGRHHLRGLLRPALLQQLTAKPHPSREGDRSAVLEASLADVALKLTRAEASTQVKCAAVALAFALTLPKLAAAVVVLAALAAQTLFVARRLSASLVCVELNACRAELCMTAFHAAERKAAALALANEAAAKKQASDGNGAANAEQDKAVPGGLVDGAKVNLSPYLVNQWECPWVLTPCFGPFYPNDESRCEQLLHRVWTSLPSLKVNLRVGAALSDVLRDRVGLSTRVKHEVINAVESSLVVRGVALVYDEASFTYFTILPERYTRDGHPSSWASLRLSALAQAQGADPDTFARARETPAEGPVWPTPARRLLWAYFYAYSHQQAAGFLGSTATAPPIPPQPNPEHCGLPVDTTRGRVEGGILRYSAAPIQPLVHVIDALRADGVLDLRQPRHPAAKVNEKEAQEECQPEKGGEGQESPREPADRDGLFPLYERFVATLERQGWSLDRFLVCSEGFTVSVMYL